MNRMLLVVPFVAFSCTAPGDPISPDSGRSPDPQALLSKFARVLTAYELAGEASPSWGREAQLESRVSCAADVPIEIRHASANVALRLRLRGAQAHGCTRRGALTLYPQSGPAGSDVLIRERSGVLEDFLYFSKRSPEEVRYEIELENVRGLRVVDDTLEVFGEAARPRLRISKPFVIDADRKVRWARLALEGCDYSDAPALPTQGAALLPDPASTRCDIRISWDDRGLRYPLVLDPPVSSTDHLAQPRVGHTATLIGDRVLVTGGFNRNNEALASTEIYTPGDRSDEEGTWSMGPAMHEARCRHTATFVKGAVLVVGGSSSYDDDVSNALATVESYVPSAGNKWLQEPKLTLPSGRIRHTATLLGDNTVVILGGGDANAVTLSLGEATAMREKTVGAAANVRKRFGHTATEAYGRIVVTGGSSDLTETDALDSVEAYDSWTDSWTDLPRMNAQRVGHTAVFLQKTDHSPGAILVVGTDTKPQLFEPISKIWTETSNPVSFHRLHHTAAVVTPSAQTSFVLVAGGEFGSNVFDQSELYQRDDNSWTLSHLELGNARFNHTMTVLADQRSLLIVGGQSRNSIPLDDFEYVRVATLGQSCTSDSECLLGHCTASGICCDTPCDRECETCLRSESETAMSDGICSPRKQGTQCRDPVECKAAGTCNGTSHVCPKSDLSPDGETCSLADGESGQCKMGVCAPPPDNDPGPDVPTGNINIPSTKSDPPTAFSCTIVRQSSARPPSVLFACFIFAALLQFCCRSRARRRRSIWSVLRVLPILLVACAPWDQHGLRDSGVNDAEAVRDAETARDGSLPTDSGRLTDDCMVDDPFSVELAWHRQPNSLVDPGARRLHGMRPWRGGVMLFGGLRGAQLLADTWHWTDNAGWMLLDATGPTARAAYALASTSASDTLVLFGGNTATGEAQDTWLWNGSWQQSFCNAQTSSCAVPSARSGHSMVYDPNHQKVVLVAGSAQGVALEDTWEWTSEAGWRKRCGTTEPASAAVTPCGFGARFDHSLVFDEALGGVLMLGGTNGHRLWDEVWLWNGTSWRQLASLPSELGARSGLVAEYAPPLGMTLVTGGASSVGISSSQVWAFAPSNNRWIRGDVLGTAFDAPASAAYAYDVTSHSLVLQGGGLATELSGTNTLTMQPLSRTQYCGCLSNCTKYCAEARQSECGVACERPSTIPREGQCASSMSEPPPRDAGLETDADVFDDAGVVPQLSSECTELHDCCQTLADSQSSCMRTALRDDKALCAALADACKSDLALNTPEARSCWELSTCCVDLKNALRASCLNLVQEAKSCDGLLNGGFCPEVP